MVLAPEGVRTSPHCEISTAQDAEAAICCQVGTSGPTLGSPLSALASLGWLPICLSMNAGLRGAWEMQALETD